jgi:AbrB family looped-hinge helix DNA binding protein
MIDMIKTGLIRRFDDLGRIVIPREVRRKLYGTGEVEGKTMEIFYEEDGTIILKPVEEK